MKCSKCEGKLKVTHSLSCNTCNARRQVCVECGTVHTSQEVFVAINPKRGQGAHDLIKKIKKMNQ